MATKRLFVAIVVLLAALYVVTSFFIGGDAYSGREAAGRFYVAHHSGAPDHEVSRPVFLLSLWEFRLLVTGWAIGIAAGFVVYGKKYLK